MPAAEKRPFDSTRLEGRIRTGSRFVALILLTVFSNDVAAEGGKPLTNEDRKEASRTLGDAAVLEHTRNRVGVLTSAIAAPTPPEQPKSGPGGAEYRHADMAESLHGSGAEKFWLFEPREPFAREAPLIIFLHGFSVMDPHGYRGWIEHLVRRGNVVVYPRYQESLFTRPTEFHPNVLASMHSAVRALKEAGRTKVNLARVAAVGHSVGGVLALKYAAAAEFERLPVPKAVVIVQPGQGPKNGVTVLPLPLTEKLSPELRLVVAVGDTDSIVGDVSARRIWRETAALKERAFVTVRTDLHGEPRLRAGHLSPMSVDLKMADALDWLGWWRILDATCDASFQNRPLHLDSDMGAWSDGRPVKPLKIER